MPVIQISSYVPAAGNHSLQWAYSANAGKSAQGHSPKPGEETYPLPVRSDRLVRVADEFEYLQTAGLPTGNPER